LGSGRAGGGHGDGGGGGGGSEVGVVLAALAIEGQLDVLEIFLNNKRRFKVVGIRTHAQHATNIRNKPFDTPTSIPRLSFKATNLVFVRLSFKATNLVFVRLSLKATNLVFVWLSFKATNRCSKKKIRDESQK
jgi:hypothetical protein